MAAVAQAASLLSASCPARVQARTQAFRSTVSLRGNAVFHSPCVRAARTFPAVKCAASASSVAAVATEELTGEGERLRLHNLAPQPGSRRKNKRKGRGYGAGQGGTCGFGMRGQKSRSGATVRPGFEGGQTPLYRRLPKLRGIAGGMPAGRTKFVTINLYTLAAQFEDGAEVSLDILKERRLLNLSGRLAKLPLKILAQGEINKPLKIAATSFSTAAREKIEAAGGSIVEVPARVPWTQAAHRERKKAEAEAAAAAKEATEAAKAARKAARAEARKA